MAQGIRISYECDEAGGPSYVVWVPFRDGVPFPEALTVASSEALQMLRISLSQAVVGPPPPPPSFDPADLELRR